MERKSILQAAPHGQTSPGQPAATSGGHILIVDDDELVGSTVALMLDSAGYSTRVVTSGVDALRWLELERYDLIVTDLCMPVMSGWELIAEIRSHLGSIPVFILTGFVDELLYESKGRADDLQVNEILLKPIRLKDLLGRLAAYLPPQARPRAGP